MVQESSLAEDNICGYHNLLRAILVQAIKDYCSNIYNISLQAETWIFSDQDIWQVSFLHICQILVLDPKKTREMIIKARGDGVTRRLKIPGEKK